MAVFNYNLQVEGVPQTWRQTEGAGVKIAVIDSGADLTHPALQHIAASPRNRFNVARPDFDPTVADLGGEDDVADAAVNGRAHGTYCASVIAAHALDDQPHGVMGVAPKAELLILKATDAEKESIHDYFLRALETAIREDVDIVSVSYVPTGVRPAHREKVESLFKQIKERNIACFVALDNTNSLAGLNDLRYPANRPEVIPVGVATPKFLASLPPNPEFNPAIRWLLPKLQVRYCDLKTSPDGLYIDDFCSASIANACLAGVAALLIAFWKQTEGAAYQRRDKAALQEGLSAVVGLFMPVQLLQKPAFQFVRP